MGTTASVARLVALAALIGVAGCASPGGLAGGTASPAAHASPSASPSPGPSAAALPPTTAPFATLSHPADAYPDTDTFETGIAFLPSGSAVIGSDYAGISYEWDAATGKITSTMAPPRGTASDPDQSNDLALSPSGATLAVNGSGGPAQANVTWLFDVASGRLIATLPSPGGVSAASAFSPDGATLAVVMEAHGRDSFGLWNVASHAMIRTVADPRGDVNAIAYSPSGATIAVADGGGAALFDAATGQLTAALKDPAPPADKPGAVNIVRGAADVAFSPSGTMLAVADGHGDVYMWDVATKRLVQTLTAPGQGGTSTATTVAFSPSGTMLAVDGGPGAYVWDLATAQVTAVLRDPGLFVDALAFSPDGKTLGDADGTGRIYLWHAPS